MKGKILASVMAFAMVAMAFSMFSPGVLALSHNFDNRITDAPGGMTYYNALDGTDGTVIYRTGSTLADPIFYGVGSGSWVTMYFLALTLSRAQDDYGNLWPAWVNDEFVTTISQNPALNTIGYTCINVLGAASECLTEKARLRR